MLGFLSKCLYAGAVSIAKDSVAFLSYVLVFGIISTRCYAKMTEPLTLTLFIPDEKKNREANSNESESQEAKEIIETDGNQEERKDKKGKVKYQKPDLKKSKSYGAPSMRDYVPSKPKFKQCLSVDPSFSKDSKGFSHAADIESLYKFSL